MIRSVITSSSSSPETIMSTPKNLIPGDQHKMCLLNYYNSKHFKITKNLKPLYRLILNKYFNGDLTYMSRDEYANGSCFFHSVVTCLNIHDNQSNGKKGDKNRFFNQNLVFENLRNRLLTGGLEDKTPTSKFNDFLHKHLFVHDDYHTLDRKTQMDLGHNLRYCIRSTLHTHWDNFWDFKNPKLALRLKRVHDKNHVGELLGDVSVWADVYMILYVMHILHLNIWFFDNENNSIYCGVQGTKIKDQPTMLVLWTNHSHFQPIVKLECTENGTPYIKSLFMYSDEIVQNIQKQYNRDGCSAIPRHQIL